MPDLSKASIIRALQDRMNGAPAPDPRAQLLPQLGGMAGNAQAAMSGRAYQLYAQETQAMGQTPVPPAAFAAGQR